MLNAFGPFGAVIGLVLVLWFFYIGFLIKIAIKELRETNRLLAIIAKPDAPAAAGPLA